MAKYLLLLREDPAHYANMSPSEIQTIIEKYTAWGESLRRAGKMHSGMKLSDDGGWHVRRGAGGVTITDGPYAEAKDIVGGFYVIEANDASEAQAIAEGCPHVENGRIEIRTVEIG